MLCPSEFSSELWLKKSTRKNHRMEVLFPLLNGFLTWWMWINQHMCIIKCAQEEIDPMYKGLKPLISFLFFSRKQTNNLWATQLFTVQHGGFLGQMNSNHKEDGIFQHREIQKRQEGQDSRLEESKVFDREVSTSLAEAFERQVKDKCCT